MFASTGLFKTVSCPFFVFGLCERPYCHFKHSRQDEAKARIELENAASSIRDTEDGSTATEPSLQKSLQDIESSILSEKEKLDKQETISGVLSRNTALDAKPTGTPEYNPTPLNELQEQKSKGKLGAGRSKYDLALLDGPDTDGEYDPASNYTTPGVVTSSDQSGASSLPEYARQLSTAGKRKAEGNDDTESPIAKIPKFVSVDYTPAIDLSDDEEPAGQFSDDQSEKGNKNDVRISESETKEKKNEKDLLTDLSGGLPLEFTPEGFVKAVASEDKRSEKSKSSVVSKSDKSKVKGKTERDKKTEGNAKSNKESTKPRDTKDKKGDNRERKSGSKEKNSDGKEKKAFNIFDSFKKEFDNDLDSCDEPKDDKSGSEKVKLKDSHHSGKSHSSKSKSESVTKHKSSSKSDCKSTYKHSEISSDHKSHHHSSSHKLSHNSSRKSGSSSHSSGDKSDKKNGAHKSEHSLKHKHNGSSGSKHKSDQHVTSKLSSDHHSHSGKSSDSKPHSVIKHDSKSSSSKHTSSKSADKLSYNNHTHDKVKSGSNHSKGKEKAKQPTKHSDKKHILNLDVDLFGKPDSENGDSPTHDFDDLGDLDQFFQEDPFDECYRIFNEASAKPSTSIGDKKKLKKPAAESDAPPPIQIGKKRVALKPGESDAKKKLVDNKPKPKPSPAQVMMERYKKAQEDALEKEKKAKQKMKEKVRVMSAQNKERAAMSSGASTSSLASAATTFTTYMASKNKKTVAVTATKGVKRKAHTPTVPIAKLKRPVVEVSSSSKVGTNIRQRYLNLFIDECLKICPNEEKAYSKGKEEEENIYKRCTNKKIYLNLAVNTVKRLRTEAEQKLNGKKSKPGGMKLTHASVLDGAGASKTSYTLHRSGGAVKLQEEDFLGAELYKRLSQYVLTESQLKENNFPRPDPDKGGTAVFYGEDTRPKTKVSLKGYEKLCVRCGKVFEVYPNGKYAIQEECVYHWGKAWKKKIAGAIDTRYTCCQGDLSSEGCQVAKLHVHETNKQDNHTGYMKTIPSSPALDGDYGVYALDCEMVYTTMGIELARVTVVGADQEPVYESLVVPDNPVVDFNTRFSGITAEDMEDVTTSLRDVQAVLLSLFTDKTILLGHSLESDLQALKLIHSVVVDTSLVFPHRLGAPYKRALKNLMAEILKKIIQDDVGGHDSLEDALACLQLMQYKLKEDARKQGRRLSS